MQWEYLYVIAPEVTESFMKLGSVLNSQDMVHSGVKSKVLAVKIGKCVVFVLKY